MEGFFQIHRQIFESWIFADDKALKIFLWLLGKARHKDGVIPLKVGKGMQYIKLKRGQMIFGRFAAEEALFYNGSLIYRKMQKMQDDETIIVESNNQYSIVTICKYEEYQTPIGTERTTNEQPTNKERTANEQGTNTNKTVNKVNNEKNDKEDIKAKRFLPPTLLEIQAYCSERKNKVDSNKFLDFYESKGWMIGRNKMKSWKACVRTWEKNETKAFGQNSQSKEKQKEEPKDYSITSFN